MGFSEMSSEGWIEPTDDTIWQFADALDISRFETYGLTAAVLFRLDVLRRNTDLFGIHAEEICQLPTGSGCWLYLCGSRIRSSHRGRRRQGAGRNRAGHLRSRPTGDLDAPLPGTGYGQLLVLPASQDRGPPGASALQAAKACSKFLVEVVTRQA